MKNTNILVIGKFKTKPVFQYLVKVWFLIKKIYIQKWFFYEWIHIFISFISHSKKKSFTKDISLPWSLKLKKTYFLCSKIQKINIIKKVSKINYITTVPTIQILKYLSRDCYWKDCLLYGYFFIFWKMDLFWPICIFFLVYILLFLKKVGWISFLREDYQNVFIGVMKDKKVWSILFLWLVFPSLE